MKDTIKKHILKYYKYNPKTGMVTGRRGKTIGTKNEWGYLRISVRINKKYFLLKIHRMAWVLFYKKWPKNHIDHINGIRTDNRIKNLRDVTRRENGSNRIEHRNGRLVGANFIKKKNVKKPWISKIRHKKKQIHLGVYKTELEAHNVYMKYKKTHSLR